MSGNALRTDSSPLRFDAFLRRAGAEALPVIGRLRVVPQLVRAGGHQVLGGAEGGGELRVVRLEKGATLEVSAPLALAVFCPASHANVRAAVGTLWLPRRSFLLLEPGGVPLVRNTSEAPLWVLAFDGAVLAQEPRLAALWPDFGTLTARAVAVLREQLLQDPSIATLAWMFETAVPAAAAPRSNRSDGHARQVLRRMRYARLYVHGNLHAGATIEDAAQVALLSKWYFSRLFQKIYGSSPQAWAAELRITRARHLVRHTTLPLSEIGALCGFENPGSMSRAFRLRYGESARALRRASKD